MIASSFILSMFNGSLTHILLFYKMVRDFSFYLSSTYDDWNPKLTLYKLAIFQGDDKEVKGIQNSYPEVLMKLSSEEAEEILEFCMNHPVKHERLNCLFLAFGYVGYYLDNTCYEKYEKIIINEIQNWLNDEYFVVSLGKNIYTCLSRVAYRMSQDVLSKICCQFIEKHYTRWYIDMFKFIANHIDLQKMNEESAKELIKHINTILDNAEERKQINYSSLFLASLRKQNRILTNEMDQKIFLYLPNIYDDFYKLETTNNKKQDFELFLKKYIKRIKYNNEKQGENGAFFGHGIQEIAIVKNILLDEDCLKNCFFNEQIMDDLITTVAETLLYSKEGVPIKLDAIMLLTSIIIQYPEDYHRNMEIYEKIYKNQEKIEVEDYSLLSSNISNISLKIGLQFMFVAIGKNAYYKILELIPYIQNDIATTLAVSRIICSYLMNSKEVLLPNKIENVILQNVLMWIKSEYVELRWNATRILFALSRNQENIEIVSNQLETLIDSDSAYIKVLIIRNLEEIKNLSKETKEKIILKCRNDNNYVVRMICAEK